MALDLDSIFIALYSSFLLGTKNSEELRGIEIYDCEFEREREKVKRGGGGGGVWILWKLESGKWKVIKWTAF